MDQLITLLSSAKAVVIPHGASARSALVEELLCALGLFSTSYDDTTGTSPILKEKVAQDEFDVFMAHSTADKTAVLRICRQLRAAGVYPWIDVEQIPPGRWLSRTSHRIAILNEAKDWAWPDGPAWLVMIPGFAVTTGRVIAVLDPAEAATCIVVLLPGVRELPAELPFLRELHYVQFESETDDDQAFKKLVWGITGEKPQG